MAFEFKALFQDKEWLNSNQELIREDLKEMPSFVGQVNPKEFWLKAANSNNSWEFDMRIFLEDYGFFVESSITTEALTKDFKKLIHKLQDLTIVNLVDDDGESLDI